MPFNEGDVYAAVKTMLDRYEDVASGKTNGGFGCFYADGEATLHAVQIPVELLERLARACGRKVHPRTKEYRDSR